MSTLPMSQADWLATSNDCPACGSDETEYVDQDYDGDDKTEEWRCGTCDARWTVVFKRAEYVMIAGGLWDATPKATTLSCIERAEIVNALRGLQIGPEENIVGLTLETLDQITALCERLNVGD